MTLENKKEIALCLQDYVKGFNSQKQAAASLENISEATLIHIINNKWDSISPAMWLNVGKQVGWNARKAKLVETMNFSTCVLYYSIAKEHGETFAITGPAGSGKSFSAKWYKENMKGQHVYYLECAAYWNKKYFLMELMQEMGKSGAGMNVYEMMKEIVSTLRKQQHPLIILDEVDKLKDEVLHFFITIYNELHGICGIVWTSTDAINKRITKGLNTRRTGYNEIFSRVGRKFIQLPGISKEEVMQVCENMGITSAEDVNKAYNEFEGDLRRVDRNYIKQVVKSKYNKAA